MALTQTARIPGPSWDEEVVPALRKSMSSLFWLESFLSNVDGFVGLEGESRTLTKRMSTTLSEERHEQSSSTSHNYNSNSSYGASSSRDHDTSATLNGSSRPPTTRTRTHSQPKLYEAPSKRTNGTQSPTLNDSSPRFQFSEPKPTRIPKSTATRVRTGSMSGSHNGPNATTNLYSTPPTPTPDQYQNQSTSNNFLHPQPMWTVREQPSTDTLPVVSRKTSSGLINNEPAPFPPGSASSNSQLEYDETPPRPSNDSEDRPFEHWYRGEVSRNGGVGELRVGKRIEMLEIANYGHTLKSKRKVAEATTPHAGDGENRRRRADSVAGAGARERESFYLEEPLDLGRVIDESPLTDPEMSDADQSTFSPHRRHYPHPYLHDTSTTSAPPLPISSDRDREVRSTTPTQRPSSRNAQTSSRIPGPAPPRTHTPTQMTRGASEPPNFPSSASLSNSPPQQTRLQQAGKRRASPGPSAPGPASSSATSTPSSTSKKPRTGTIPKPKPQKGLRSRTLDSKKALDKEQNRRSIAHYPEVEGDMMMMDAIPSWTQPVPADGKGWDDVSESSRFFLFSSTDCLFSVFRFCPPL